MPPDYFFDVDMETMLALPKSKSYVPNAFELKQSVLNPKCYEPSSFSVKSFSGEFPTCPDCGSFARPSILMFNADDTKKWIRRQASEDNWEAFKVKLTQRLRKTPDTKITILEIGAGVNVPSLRFASERLLRTVRDEHRSCSVPTLIRINPDAPEMETKAFQENTVPIKEKALKAIREIDKEIDIEKMNFL